MSRVRLHVLPPSDESPFDVEGTVINYDADLGKYLLKLDDGAYYGIFTEFVGKVEELDEAE